MAEQFGIRLDGAELAWLQEQIAAGGTARQAVEAAIRLSAGATSTAPRTHRVAGQVRLGRLTQHVGRRLRDEVHRRVAAETRERAVVPRLALVERQRGEIAAEAAEARAEPVTHDREAKAWAGAEAEGRIAATTVEALRPIVTAIHVHGLVLEEGVRTQADAFAAAARDRQRHEDEKVMRATGISCTSGVGWTSGLEPRFQPWAAATWPQRTLVTSS